MKRRKRIRIGALALAAAAAVTATSTASAHMPKTITIRHQMHGCHAWAASPTGAYKATLKLKADRDTGLVIVNNDVMPHKLVQLSGPKALLAKVNMNRMSARAYITFGRAGVYRFGTKAGEDYPGMHMHTHGADDILRLTVTVR